MSLSFGIGSKCALLLPREIVNPQITPAKGLIINKLLDRTSLVLIEEVWQFKGLPDQPMKDMCTSYHSIRNIAWDWIPLPQLLEEFDDYLIVPAKDKYLKAPTVDVLEKMITKTINDFFEVKRSNG
jgi:hypothetical protein